MTDEMLEEEGRIATANMGVVIILLEAVSDSLKTLAATLYPEKSYSERSIFIAEMMKTYAEEALYHLKKGGSE
jgi:hypothetical protein